MVATEAVARDRVIWVGTGRRRRRRRFLPIPIDEEPTSEWRGRLTQEMNEACDEMASQGLRLVSIVPVASSRDLHGSWTESAWLHFTRAE